MKTDIALTQCVLLFIHDFTSSETSDKNFKSSKTVFLNVAIGFVESNVYLHNFPLVLDKVLHIPYFSSLKKK